MIPAFAIAIPHLSGYFGPYTPVTGMYWIGLAWSLVISFTIWHGNRYFLLKQRQHYDWFQQPIRKVTVLAFACVFYTAPCAVLMMLAWYAIAGFGPDWNVIRLVTLACIICVAFITHVYETVYLIRQREDDMLAVERLERARTQAELEALKSQVAPHFLFNSLNTLAWLIENSPQRALAFNQNLADVYRYILLARRRDLVPLEEEWQFLQQYCDLLRLRFEDSLDLDLADPGERGERWYVPPISLQILIENAVKHNQHSSQFPLHVQLRFEDGWITVSNEKRARTFREPSSRTGLRTLNERCRLVLGRGIEVIDEPGRFTVRVAARVV
jgi:Histidine kinase